MPEHARQLPTHPPQCARRGRRGALMMEAITQSSIMLPSLTINRCRLPEVAGETMRMPPKGLLTLRSRRSLVGPIPARRLAAGMAARLAMEISSHTTSSTFRSSSARSLFGGMLRSVVGNTSRGMIQMK
jgi:hypothetical protein